MLFGTSGIRGKFGEKITDELAYKCGYVFGDKELAIAGDLRKSTPILINAIINGALERGKKIYYLGFVPTPILAYFTQIKKIPGIMVTASHNPEEDNGLKFYRDGNEISKSEEKEIEEKIKNFKKEKNNKIGEIINIDFKEEYLKLIRKNINIEKIKKIKPLVVVDCNGVTKNITPLILEMIGCKVITINCSGDGFYRPSEPEEKNLGLLKKVVKEKNALLGIAHDGDGDRIAVVDENGEFIEKDVLLAMFVEKEVKNAYVGTVEQSMMINDILKEKNAKIYIVPVGSRNVSNIIKKENADFGGEPAGEFIFKNGVRTGDGVLSAAKIIEIAIEKKLSEYKKKFKTYPIKRLKFKVNDKEKTMEKIKEKINGNEIDGIRIEDEGFILIRPSGTENVIRLTIEQKTEEKLNKKLEYYKKIIESCLN